MTAALALELALTLVRGCFYGIHVRLMLYVAAGEYEARSKHSP
jgi:hypothetical protein